MCVAWQAYGSVPLLHRHQNLVVVFLGVQHAIGSLRARYMLVRSVVGRSLWVHATYSVMRAGSLSCHRNGNLVGWARRVRHAFDEDQDYRC